MYPEDEHPITKLFSEIWNEEVWERWNLLPCTNCFDGGDSWNFEVDPKLDMKITKTRKTYT